METPQYLWSPFYVDSLIERDTTSALITPTLDTTFNYNLSSPTVVAPSGDTITEPTPNPNFTAVYAPGSVDGGDIVVAINLTGSSPGVEIVRYNANGTLDGSFGTGGKVFESGWPAANCVAVQTDGKVLVGLDGEIARLNADGTPDDANFGVDGLATANGNVTVIVERGDGEILAGTDFIGFYGWGWNEYDISVALFNASGGVDTNFGTAGSTSVFIGDEPVQVSVIDILPSGKILMAGCLGDGGVCECLCG